MTGGLLEAAASGLAFWPGLLLAAGGVSKARDLRGTGAELRRTVVARLVADRLPVRGVWAVLAAAELAVGALVLAGVRTPWPEAAAAVLLGAAALVVAWGLRNAPDAGCGCFGARARARVSRRSAVRAGLLAAFAAVAAVGGESWTSVLDRPAAILVVLAAGVPLALLSPGLPRTRLELREAASFRVGRATVRAQRIRDAACERRRVPVERTAAHLRRSDLWRRASPHLRAETPTEHWRQGCFRLLCYPADYEGEAVTAVFAVHLGLRQTPRTVAFVDEDDRRVLGRLQA